MSSIENFDEALEILDSDSYTIERGTIQDLEALENLYDVLNDHLAKGTNYPGWI